MKVVPDANVVAAALLRPEGWTARILSRDDVEWVVPAFLAEELEAHAVEFSLKAGCTPEAWCERTRAFLRRARVVGERDLAAVMAHRLVRRARLVDCKDAAYVAAAVASGADHVWTRDRRLLLAFPRLAVDRLPPA